MLLAGGSTHTESSVANPPVAAPGGQKNGRDAFKIVMGAGVSPPLCAECDRKKKTTPFDAFRWHARGGDAV